MDQITNLLNLGLGTLLPAFMLGLKEIERRFTETDALPTWRPIVMPLMMLVVSIGLALGNRSFAPPATNAAETWWVQGALFFFAMLLGNRLTETVYINSAKAKGEVKVIPPSVP